MSIKIKLYFFATFRELVGKKTMYLEISQDHTVRGLKNALVYLYPNLTKHIGHALISINRKFAFDEDKIMDNDEVAIFPPVSGGNDKFPTICQVTSQEIDIDQLTKRITLSATGAVCTFIGVVRELTLQPSLFKTLSLEYESYEAMAIDKMNLITKEMRERWPELQGILMVQRLGTLYPGNVTVLIACGAAHRDGGIFDAARYGIDRLKQIVPVWKKQVGTNEKFWIEGNYHPKPGE